MKKWNRRLSGLLWTPLLLDKFRSVMNCVNKVSSCLRAVCVRFGCDTTWLILSKDRPHLRNLFYRHIKRKKTNYFVLYTFKTCFLSNMNISLLLFLRCKSAAFSRAFLIKHTAHFVRISAEETALCSNCRTFRAVESSPANLSINVHHLNFIFK